jgi:hypothetical protein
MSIFKKSSTEQAVVLQDLTEEQLTQVAGGSYCRNDYDDDRWNWHHQHHQYHHQHHHHQHHHTWKKPTSWQTTSWQTTSWHPHW